MTPRRQLIILLLFLAGGFCVFSNIITSYFLSDDFVQIGKVLNGDFSVVWGQAHGGFFRPLFILSYIVDAKIWGARPFGFHLTNVALHSFNAFLVFALSLRLVGALKLSEVARQTLSIAAGALFLLHPSHTEAVSWISGRADLLAMGFSLASLLAYLAYSRSQRNSRLFIALSCFALALLAKESAICVPFFVLVIGLFTNQMHRGKETSRRFLISLALYVSILLIFIAVRSVLLGTVVGGYGPDQHLNLSPSWLRDRLLEASLRSFLPALPDQLARYLFKPLQSRVFILSSVFCAALVIAFVFLRHRWLAYYERREENRFLLVLALLFLLSLLPVINLRLSLYESSGERFLYMPTAFSCLLLVYLTTIVVRKPALWISILIGFMGLYAICTYQTNQVWREAATLSQRIIDELPGSTGSDRLLLINAPDNLRGVPVFHNGLPEALSYFQNQKRISETEILAFQRLQSADDKVIVNRRPESVTIQLMNSRGEFPRVVSVECLYPVFQSKTFLEFGTRPCLKNKDVLFFDQGKIIRLSER
jgi:protein O-mannosyl-transferase